MQVASGLRKNPCVMFFTRLSDREVTLIFIWNAADEKKTAKIQSFAEVLTTDLTNQPSNY
jgi:hypothetical protein